MGTYGAGTGDGLQDPPSVEARRALDELYSITYEELRRLASSVRHSSPGSSLSPTTLVHEAWVKLAGSPGVAATSRLHFKRIAARAMRQVLVDAARRKYAGKRGGRDVVFATLPESVGSAESTPEDILALNTALTGLERMNPQHARMAEYRFFGGLEIAEIAELLEVSEAKVSRDLRAVRAWLATRLREPG